MMTATVDGNSNGLYLPVEVSVKGLGFMVICLVDER